MHATLVYVHVKPSDVKDFIEATRLNHEAAVEEPGNLRFDVLQLEGDESKFVLYEAYRYEEDAIAHRETEHYKIWRETVADMMGEERHGVVHKGLFPTLEE